MIPFFKTYFEIIMTLLEQCREKNKTQKGILIDYDKPIPHMVKTASLCPLELFLSSGNFPTVSFRFSGLLTPFAFEEF